MSGCDNSTDTESSTETQNFVGGTFTRDGVTTSFYANKVGRKVRAASDLEALEGKIQERSIIFNISGFYDPATGSFVLSAGSGSLVFEINGILNGNGNNSASARVRVKDEVGNWTTHELAVAFNTNVQVSGEVSSEQKSGLPQEFLGRWILTGVHYLDLSGNLQFFEYEDAPVYYVITPFALTAGAIYENMKKNIEKEIDERIGNRNQQELAKRYGFSTFDEYRAALVNIRLEEELGTIDGASMRFLEIEKQSNDSYNVLLYSAFPKNNDLGYDSSVTYLNPKWKRYSDTIETAYFKLKFVYDTDNTITYDIALNVDGNKAEFSTLGEARAANNFTGSIYLLERY